RLARLMVDAGADVVAGHHPHVLQGLDPGPRAAVAYSLGNFVWYHSSPPSDTTAILRTEHPPAGGVRAEVLPARIDGTGSPRLLTGSQAQAVRSEVASLQPGYGRC
ncbi:MAG TPA: CapA family protein, partial [Acidimicrobiales bacterium]|nr:CapA family protein [Acidimicrobiales bacterium]